MPTLGQDSLFNTVKQGTQLFKESAEATSALSSKAGLPQTPSTPQETAVIGGTPSQAKMAGTPAALKGQAVKANLPTSLYLATQARREQPKQPTGEEAQAIQNAQNLSQKLAGLGSLGQRVPSLIQAGVQRSLTGIKPVRQLDEAKIDALTLTPEQKGELKTSLRVLDEPTTTTNQQAQNDAGAKVANLLGMTQAQLSAPGAFDSYYKDAAASVSTAIDATSLNSINLGDLPGGAQTLGYSSWGDLATDLGIQVPDGKSAEDVFKGMTVKELGDAVDTAKRRGFQSQQEWQAVLQDPTSSPQDRAVARSILRNMGATGIREAEDSVAQLTSQVQAANRVTVNLTGTPQSMDIQDILTKPNLKAAVAILMDPNDKSYAAVSAANPDLAAWVTQHKQELQNVVKDVGQDAKNLADLNAQNSQVLKLPGLDDKTIDKVGKLLYPNDWGKISGQKYDLTKAPLLANWSKIPASEQSFVSGALAAIVDGGGDADVQAFLNTSRDNLVRLGLNTQDGLDKFKSWWSENKLIRSIDATSNSDSNLFDLTGYNQAQLSVLNKENAALGSLGLYTNTVLPANLSQALNQVKGPKSVSELLTGNALPSTLKDAFKNYNAKVDALKSSTNVVNRALATAVLDSDGMPSADRLRAVATQVTTDTQPADAIKNLDSLEWKTGSNFAELKNKFAGDQISQAAKSVNLVDFDKAMDEVRKNPEQSGDILTRYRNLQNNLPSSGPVYDLYKKKLAELDTNIANFMTERGSGVAVIGEPGPMYTDTGYIGTRFLG